MSRSLLKFTCALLAGASMFAAAPIPLTSDVPAERAALIPFLSTGAKPTGGAVAIVPGDNDAEATKLAGWLNEKGIAAFVVRYRGGEAAADVNRVVSVLRARAGELGISPKRIALLGLGRGAELAADAAYNVPGEADVRPNLLAVVGGARLPAATVPVVPTFIVGPTNEGEGKSVAFDLWAKLRAARVAVDAHLFAKAGPAPESWPDMFFAWVRFQGLLTEQPRVPVKGMVYLDGRTLPHGYVIFTPVDFAGAGPIIGRVFNSTPSEAMGFFSIPASQGAVAGRYRVDVRQNMNRWLSNGFTGGMAGGGRGGNAPTPEQIHFGHHRVLTPSIADQRSFTKVRPTDKDDYIIEIKPDAAANLDVKLEVFSGAKLVATADLPPAPENVGGLTGGPKNPGQNAYVEQIRHTPPGPVPGIPEPTLLWPNGAPEAVADANGVFTDEDKPALYSFPVRGANNSKAAFLILPGGGFTNRVMDTEGVQIAKFLNQHGVGGFVLRYRLSPNYARRTISTMDGQRAMRYLRAHAAELGLDPQKIGVIGFSAGGELQGDAFYNAALEGDAAAADPIDRQSARANFSVLIYGARNPQKPADAPPTFIFNTIEDGGPRPAQIAVLNALRQANVPVEAHFYQVGPHGTTMSPGDPQLGQWPTLMLQWLAAGGFVPSAPKLRIN